MPRCTNTHCRADSFYSIIERMILDALKCTPTTAQSRTDHFKSKARAQTPMRRVDSDSSLSSHTDTETFRQPGLEIDPGDITSCGESDGDIERALISESFKKSSAIDTVPVSTTTSGIHTSSEGFESSGATIQDVTFSEIRERTLEEGSLGSQGPKRPEEHHSVVSL